MTVNHRHVATEAAAVSVGRPADKTTQGHADPRTRTQIALYHWRSAASGPTDSPDLDGDHLRFRAEHPLRDP